MSQITSDPILKFQTSLSNLENRLLDVKITLEDLIQFKDDKVLLDCWLKDLSFTLGERIEIISYLKSYKKNKKVSIYYKIPVLNIFYETFFDQLPDLGAIEGVLELFGIMGALLFSIAMALATNYTYDDYENAVTLWTSGNLYGDCWVDGYVQIEYFVDHSTLAVSTTFMAVVFVTLMYMVLKATNFDHEEDLKRWWLWSRWILIVTFALLVIGATSMFLAYGNSVQWTVPNKYVLENGCNFGIITSLNNPWGRSNSINLIVSIIVGIPFLLLLSMAVYEKNCR